MFHFFETVLDKALESSVKFRTFVQAHEYVSDFFVDEHTKVCCGATRAAIIDDRADFIVKFDIDEDSRHTSLCEKECDVYDDALSNGVERFFAEPKYIGTFKRTFAAFRIQELYEDADFCMSDCGDEDIVRIAEELNLIEVPISISIDLYMYPKATRARHRELSPVAHSLTRSPLGIRDMEVADIFYQEYGEEKFWALSEFLEWEDINDMHFGNIGVVDGHYVIIDYAGFKDSEEYIEND